MPACPLLEILAHLRARYRRFEAAPSSTISIGPGVARLKTSTRPGIPSHQGALAVLFITGYEDGLSDEVLRDYARSFDFRHIERMLAEVQAPEAYEHWRQTFQVRLTLSLGGPA